MRADLLTTAVPVTPGVPVQIELEVRNTESMIDQITCDIDELDATRYEQLPLALTLFPDESARVSLIVDLPRSYPAGFHELTVRTRGRASGGLDEQHVLIEVQPVVAPSISVTPLLANGGSRATFTVNATNSGNTDLQLALRATDANQKLRVTVEPATLRVPPGETASASVEVRGRRALFGAPVLHPITISGEQLPHVVTAAVQFRQKPRFPTGLMTALTLAFIVLLWALAVSFGVRAAMSSDVPKKAIPASFAAGADPEALDPMVVGSPVSGVVKAATTRQPAPRVTVELFDTRGARRGSATKEDGTFQLNGVLPGTYKVRYRAAGYEERWYPGVADRAAADPVTVFAATPLEDLAMDLVGLPGSLSGTVLAGDDPSLVVEVTVQAIDVVPAAPVTSESVDADTTTGSVVAAAPTTSLFTQQISAGGTFRVAGLTTPATYRVRVTAPGFQAQELQEKVAAGADLVLNTIRLTASPGVVGGTVVDLDGRPVGEVSVTTSVDDQELSTVTPTAGAVGQFRIADLPSPDTYQISFTKPGYGTIVQSVRLGPGEQRTDLRVVLAGATGAASGDVTASDGSRLGGVKVDIVGGTTNLTTVTFTSGDIGGYRLNGLPLPGSYTLVFSREGFRTATVRVSLTRDTPVADVSVALDPAVSTLTGVVRSSNGQGVGGAVVEVADGINVRTTSTATAPASSAGNYRMVDLPPGTYTITVRAAGYREQTRLVTVVPGQSLATDFALEVDA